ncbi:hypothetical protein V9K67_17455 [Paraflavisolibacter sp. H34]|uniref:hypothetical protein n=1 Tax=Huijunlia imazamoxiresistens TaxID=3127457 RepID=UPI003016C912
MTFRQFQQLSKFEQRVLLDTIAVYLMNLETTSFAISLFQLESFYVELFFLKERNEVIWVNAFEETAKLSPYLEKIDLSELSDCLL